LSHSVSRHLRVEVDAYDQAIRRFIPGYDAMLRVAAEVVAAARPRRVTDLGAGTGALAEAILDDDNIDATDNTDREASRVQELVLIDIDPDMLAKARTRLARFGDRVSFRQASYHDELPASAAVASSLALHHVPDMASKCLLYKRIHDSLDVGGVFVNADAVMPAEPPGRDATFEAWASHMASHGISREQAFAHFAEWAEEDTYQPLEEELAALKATGFRAECE